MQLSPLIYVFLLSIFPHITVIILATALSNDQSSSAATTTTTSQSTTCALSSSHYYNEKRRRSSPLSSSLPTPSRSPPPFIVQITKTHSSPQPHKLPPTRNHLLKSILKYPSSPPPYLQPGPIPAPNRLIRSSPQSLSLITPVSSYIMTPSTLISGVGLSMDFERVVRSVAGWCLRVESIFTGSSKSGRDIAKVARDVGFDNGYEVDLLLASIENNDSPVILKVQCSQGTILDLSLGGGGCIGSKKDVVERGVVEDLFMCKEKDGVRGLCYDSVCSDDLGGEDDDEMEIRKDEWRGLNFCTRALLCSLCEAFDAELNASENESNSGIDYADKGKDEDTSKSQINANNVDVIIMSRNGVYRLSNNAVKNAIDDVRRIRYDIGEKKKKKIRNKMGKKERVE